MAAPVQITFDALDPNALCVWWAELLGYEVERDGDFVAGLLEQGAVTEAEVVEIDGVLHFTDAASMLDPDGAGPRVYFQRVPEAKTAKNRVDLDVPAGDIDLEAAVEHQTQRGDAFVGYGTQGGHRWAVMQEDEGNEFCLV